jgi:hypothetical protein
MRGTTQATQRAANATHCRIRGPALRQPGNANTLHFVTDHVTANVVANTLMLYGRLFAVAKTMNSTTTQAVSGTITCYQNAAATAADCVGGISSVLSSPTTALPAVAHNGAACRYTHQRGVVGQRIPSIAGVSVCAASGVDLAAWLLHNGDSG